MALAQFEPIARRIYETGSVDIRLGDDTAFSLPVVVRRGDTQYDGVFLYRRPTSQATAGRPFAWALLEAATGDVALLCRCDLVDFVPPGRCPADVELVLALPKELSEKKQAALWERLLESYGRIREFAFEESLTRQQAGVVTEYKELFGRLSYPAHYLFYHALSPAFFHWLRLPLPKEAAGGEGQAVTDLQRDGYQLLILENMQQLTRQFAQKIAVDTHKERLFDDLHRELQAYKNDLLGALTLSLERDVIQVIDSVCKTVEAFRGMEPDTESYARLLELFAGVETDLTDLLYRHGVEPYEAPGPDPGRQKVLGTVKTADAALDKTIAIRHAKGWEKEGKVIRPERISVYLYEDKAGQAPVDDGTGDNKGETDDE